MPPASWGWIWRGRGWWALAGATSNAAATPVDYADAKRLVDFAAGLIFGLHGRIERITSKVFLLSPQNVNVAAEDKERIAGGFFNQS